MLLLSLLCCVFLICHLVWRQHHHFITHDAVNHQGAVQGAHLSFRQPPSAAMSVWMVTLIVVLSASLYAVLGRYPDHQNQQITSQLDYLLRERVQQLASQQPNANNLQQQAAMLADLGDYNGAATTQQTLLDQFGEQPAWLGQLATYQYYRDGRVLSDDSTLIVARALAIEPNELNSLLLLANHAYLNGDYRTAIDHWDRLLAAAPIELDVAAITRAKAKAMAQLAQ